MGRSREFERYANEIPEFVAQVGDIPGHQDRSDQRQASPECGDGKDGRRDGRGHAFSKASSKGASKGARKGKDSEVVSSYCVKKGHRASKCSKKQKDLDKGQLKGAKKAHHFEIGSAILAWAVELSGQVVSRFQISVSDGKTASASRKQKSYRKVLVPFGELLMFMPMEKPKDKGEIQNRVGIMLGLEDRSHKVVGGTTEWSKARTVQRGDARYAKSIRCVLWQSNPAEAAEGEVFRWFRSNADQQFHHRACRFYIRRELELAKCGVADDSEGCCVAHLG